MKFYLTWFLSCVRRFISMLHWLIRVHRIFISTSETLYGRCHVWQCTSHMPPDSLSNISSWLVYIFVAKLNSLNWVLFVHSSLLVGSFCCRISVQWVKWSFEFRGYIEPFYPSTIICLLSVLLVFERQWLRELDTYLHLTLVLKSM